MKTQKNKTTEDNRLTTIRLIELLKELNLDEKEITQTIIIKLSQLDNPDSDLFLNK